MSYNKTQRKQILQENIRVGKLCENIAREEYIRDGWIIISASRGYDFHAVKESHDGQKLSEYVEVKKGDAKLSKIQISTMHKCKREGKSYRVFRVNSYYINSNFTKQLNSYLENKSNIENVVTYKNSKRTKTINSDIPKLNIKDNPIYSNHENTLYENLMIMFLAFSDTIKHWKIRTRGMKNND